MKQSFENELLKLWNGKMLSFIASCHSLLAHIHRFAISFFLTKKWNFIYNEAAASHVQVSVRNFGFKVKQQRNENKAASNWKKITYSRRKTKLNATVWRKNKKGKLSHCSKRNETERKEKKKLSKKKKKKNNRKREKKRKHEK